MTSDGRAGGRGGSAKSDFISKVVLIKHLMRGGGGVKKWQKSSDVIYGRPLMGTIVNFKVQLGMVALVSFPL